MKFLKRGVNSLGGCVTLVRNFGMGQRLGSLLSLILIALIVSAESAAAAIAFVQVNSATPQTPQTSVAVAYTAAQTAGNLNVVVVGWADSTATVNSVTDSNKNSYTLAVGPTMQGGASQSIYYAKNIVAGVNTVTVTFNGAASYPDIRILEYSGLDTVSPVDVVASASGSSATSSTAAVTTTNANDLIFAANDVATYTTGPGTGFTSRIITQDGDIAQDRIVTATGSYSAGAPLGMSGGWVMQMVAFKAAGSAPPPNPTLTVTKSGSGTGTVTSAPAGINCGSTCSASFASGTSVTLTATADAGSTATGFNGGCSSASSTCTFTITANAAVTATFNLNDTQAPTAPSNLAATAAATGGQINLTWTASTDNVGVSGYWIERCQGAGCSSFARINPSLVTTTNYGDSGLGANTSYTYRVQAADAAGNLSPYSGTASATTAAGTGTTTAINFVQINSAVPQTPQTSVSVNYQGKQTAGNLNVVVVGWSDSTSTISSVTDTKGNIYSLAVGPTRQSGVQSQSIYYAKNIVAADINTNTVTVQFSNAVSYPDVRILEYSGLDTTNPVDVVAEATNTSATSSTAAVTTTHAYDLIFAANYVVTSTSGAGAGFTNRIITYPDGNIAEDQIVTSTGSYSATAPLNSSGGWVMQMVAFKGAANSPPPPSQVGQWSAVMNWPLVSIHGAVMPTGKVLVWDSDTSSSKTSNSGGNGVQVWDPIANTFSTVPFDAGDLFCAGLAELPDGRVFVVGGHNINNYNGLTGVAIFDPSTNSWGTGASMAFPRWYPTVTALPDGRMLATSGAMNCQDCNADTPEVYDPAKNTWTQLTNATIHLPLYPHMFTLPDGRVLVTGSYESYIEPVVIQVLDLNTQTWTTVDPTPVNGGSAAMYLPGKIITSGLGTLGGADVTTTPSTTTTYVLDMTQPTPAWRQTSPMAYPRDYHNMTILPDGNVLVTGGGQTTGATDPTTAVFAAELWSPATETWTTLSSMQTPRRYHSIALLLPDGRVLVAGGGRNNGAYTATNANDHLNAEIFSPPYLFKGARPTITTAPTTLPYGTNAFVATPDGASISSVSLIRLGAVTHAFNMNQRFLNLTFSQASGGLNVQAPANANLAPPGYYMLFLVNGNGVPSVASILKVQ